MPFEAGKSGNPGGKPKVKPFADALRMEISEAGSHPKALRNVAKKLIELAEEGKMDAIKEFIDRLDGKVPQGVIGGDEDDNPVNVITRIVLTAKKG